MSTPADRSRADQITRLLGRRVRELRKAAGMDQAALGARMAEVRPGWSRSAVAKLENDKRATLSVGDLLALALVLDVPLPLLIADPRHVDEVPIAAGITVSAWEALLWLVGTGTIAKSELDNFGRASWLIHAGWTVVESLVELDKRDLVFDPDDADQVRRAQERDDARHRVALRALAAAMARITAAGAPPPPMLPLGYVQRRACELGVRLPGMED